MSAPVAQQRGFSLPEVLLAMVLLVMVVTALSGYYRELVKGFEAYSHYQQVWRYGQEQSALQPGPLPQGWRVNRVQTTTAGCVSISVTITSPAGRQGQLLRLHCPISQ